MNGSAITLVTSYKFHWEKMNEDGSRELIESVIGRLVNQTVSVTTEMRGASAPQNGTASPNSDVRSASDRSPSPAATPLATPGRSDDESMIVDAARNIFDAEEITPHS